jgi:hypothetical protein
MLVGDVVLHNNVRAENTARSGFLEASVDERDVGPKQSAWGQEEARSGKERLSDAMLDDNGPARGELTARYARAFTPAPGLESGIRPEATAIAIDSMLGQLQADHEAVLRAPLLGMRLAEKALIADGDSRSVRQLSHWAAIFTARANEIAIPDGTRAKLVGLVAMYQHDALAMNTVRLQAEIR